MTTILLTVLTTYFGLGFIFTLAMLLKSYKETTEMDTPLNILKNVIIIFLFWFPLALMEAL